MIKILDFTAKSLNLRCYLFFPFFFSKNRLFVLESFDLLIIFFAWLFESAENHCEPAQEEKEDADPETWCDT